MREDETTVDAAAVRAAHERLQGTDIVRQTPVEPSRSVGKLVDADVRLKMEHLQRTGSFKPRGAYNKIHRLATAGVERVVAASAGNHAQGVALAATELGLESTIVMPRDAPQVKIDATEQYGGRVVLHGTDFQAAVAHARSLAAADDSAFVHAYDDPAVVAGQGTVAVEVLEQVPNLDVVVVPVGGGGLIGGVAAYLAEAAPDVRVVGVQAANAETVQASLRSGTPETIEGMTTVAEGIATGRLSELTLDLIERDVDRVVAVPDADIASAVLFLLERAKQLVEGAGAVSVAALVDGAVDVDGMTVVPILSGGNLDMTVLEQILTHELTARRRLLSLRVRIVDEPGRMAEISTAISEAGGNIRDVRHERADATLEVGEAYLVFLVETSGASNARDVRDAIADRGYEVERVN